MGRQGYFLTEPEVTRIVMLLADTDMTIVEIANRMGCSRNAIAKINRRFNVRKYSGLKRWELQIDSNRLAS
jgi:hypothetical protein